MQQIYATKFLVMSPTKHGVFAFYLDDDPIGTCLYYYGEWAEQEFDIISKLVDVNTNCIDIGSNIGTHTVWLSKRCNQGHIFSIEPQFYIFQVLNTNLVLNDCFNVLPIHAGIANESGKCLTQIAYPKGYSQKQNYGEFSLLKQNSNEGYPIDIKQLDEIDYFKCDIGFIKMDCELMESNVLISGKKLINKDKPHMYIEFNWVDGNDEVLNILKDYGYNCYWHVYDKHNVNNFNKFETNIYVDHTISKTIEYIPRYYEANLIAIHKEKDKGMFTDKIELGDNIVKWLVRHDMINV